MGGQVGLRSRPEEGTTFWCTALFQKQLVCAPAIVPSAELSGRRILIVDDNESNRTILHHLVSGWGMQDSQARNAAEAMELLTQAAAKGQPYDAAVLDMLMPGKDGLQLAQDIKTHPQGAGVRLIVLTSLIQPGHAERARRAGFAAYLTKPVRHDQLRAASESYSGYSRIRTGHIRNRKTPAGRPPLITRRIRWLSRLHAREFLSQKTTSSIRSWRSACWIDSAINRTSCPTARKRLRRSNGIVCRNRDGLSDAHDGRLRSDEEHSQARAGIR